MYLFVCLINLCLSGLITARNITTPCDLVNIPKQDNFDENKVREAVLVSKYEVPMHFWLKLWSILQLL